MNRLLNFERDHYYILVLFWNLKVGRYSSTKKKLVDIQRHALIGQDCRLKNKIAKIRRRDMESGTEKVI